MITLMPDELLAVLPDNVDVSLVWVAEKGQAPGFTTKAHEGKYVIALNAPWFSKLVNPRLRIAVMKGILLHEVLHVRYTDFDALKNIDAGKFFRTDAYNPFVLSFIFNLLEDLRIEYLCMKDFTSLARYLSVALAYVGGMRLTSRRSKNRLKRSIEAIYQAARFGSVSHVLLTDDVKDDLRFVLPKLFVVRRGTATRDMLDVAKVIYAYLDSKYHVEDEFVADLTFRSAEEVVSIAKKASRSKDKAVKPPQSGKQNVDVLPWKSVKKVSEDFSSVASEESPDRLGKRAVKPHGVPDYLLVNPSSLKDLHFYINTVKSFEETIREIRKLFARKGLEQLLSPSEEGELNLKLQQDAYLDSYTFDLGSKFYLAPRRLKPALDVCILLDQSSSMEIEGRHVKAAEACVILLESLTSIPAIRASVVGFGGGVRVLKDFHEIIAQGRFYPQAMGGTPLGEALTKAHSLSWRPSERKSLILITDGYPDSWEEVDKALLSVRLLRKTHIIALCLEERVPQEYVERFRNVKVVEEVGLLPRLLAEEVKAIA